MEGDEMLMALAEACEKAEGPNETLDECIAEANGLPRSVDAPDYTASLDAAMALMPEGWRVIKIGEEADDSGTWNARLGERRDDLRGRSIDVTAASPALALCAAALRARAAMEGQSQ